MVVVHCCCRRRRRLSQLFFFTGHGMLFCLQTQDEWLSLVGWLVGHVIGARLVIIVVREVVVNRFE